VGDVEKTLLALEEEFWRANREGDADFYDRTLRDDALLVSRFGLAGKAQVVAGIGANRNPFVRTALSDQRVTVLSDTVAMVNYRAGYTALINGAEVDFTVLATSVYVREGDAWRSVLHQQSAV
jgi:ketosteroid isomerase-like protein